jgi:putative Ca2+/H+ antiporter (TMEM165/GDT1 family)
VDLAVVATAFVLIFPVELPDKTFVASLVLATRYRPLPVWIGVSLAFLVQCIVAVTAGSLLSLLPEEIVAAAAGLLFLLGAILLWRGAGEADSAEQEAEEEAAKEVAVAAAQSVSSLKAASASFGVLFLAEWGDLSQLLTAGLAARYHDALSVLIGSWLALIVVAGLAVVLGRTLLRYVKLSTIRRVGAGVCLVLALVAAYDVVHSMLT